MVVETGQMLSHFRLVEKIGEGGMGVVWRAADTTLDREVAIKILPEAFSADPDRLIRFSREAKLLASLNHPHIAAVYGAHETSGIRFLAMELVGGEDLSDRIARGRLPLDEVVSIGRQLAEALAAAHDAGVIHRDLKPANIRLDARANIKVLDFGLAKAVLPDTLSGSAPASLSPTVTSAGTIAGVLLGTAAYMSPEQARGKPVGRTADIWAYGCILFEMLSGRSVFRGETVTDVVAAVITREPDWDKLPNGLPLPMHRLLHRCLEKDPEERLQHIGDARLELRDAMSAAPEAAGDAAADTSPAPARRSPLLVAAGTIAAVSLGFLGARLLMPQRATAPPDRPVTRLEMPLPHPLDGSGLPRRVVALSPDGRRLAYAGVADGHSAIFIRNMDGSESEPIPESDAGLTPFFSPDGRNVAFYASGKLKRASLYGGAPLELTEAPGLFLGGSWSEDGTIVYMISNYRNPQLVSADGGQARELVVQRDEGSEGALFWPEFLPGGKAFLATLSSGPGLAPENHICVVDVKTGALRILERGSDARYVSAGYIVYFQGNSLLAAPFDSESMRLTGPAIAIPTLKPYDINGNRLSGAVAGLAVSREGTLAYATGNLTPDGKLVWVDRSGRIEPVAEEQQLYNHPVISPDGRRILVWVMEGRGTSLGDLWLYDFDRRSFSRLTTDQSSVYGTWAPDGETIYYISSRSGHFGIYSKQARAGGEPKEVMLWDNPRLILSFDPSGETSLFYEVNPETQRDIWSWKLGEEPKPLVVTPHNERAPTFSPDGKFFAYVSNEAGRDDIYVRRFPDDGSRWVVSSEGGTEPRFNPNGRELFYRQGDRMMVVEIARAPLFEPGRPRELFQGEFRSDQFAIPNYDISPDGQRFLMVRGVNNKTARLEIVLNWDIELAELFAANR